MYTLELEGVHVRLDRVHVQMHKIGFRRGLRPAVLAPTNAHSDFEVSELCTHSTAVYTFNCRVHLRVRLEGVRVR